MENIETVDPMDHDEYLARRNELLKIKETSVDSYDKSILQISSAGLGIMITFMNRFSLPKDKISMFLLSTTIGLLVAISVIIILSFVFSKINSEFKLDDLDKRYKRSLKSGVGEKENKSKFKAAANFCSASSLWLFLLAILTFGIYSFRVIDYHKKVDVPKEEEDAWEKR